MKLQQQVLNLYLEYHAKPPSLVSLFGRNLGRYLLTIFVFSLAFLLAYAIQRPNLAALVLGLLIGALVRDLAVFLRFIRTWKITESVLDWDRITTLINAEPGSRGAAGEGDHAEHGLQR